MRSILSSLCLVFTFVAAPSLAATKVWSGTGLSALWSLASNWQGGVPPVTGDRLVFPPGTAGFATNDLGPLELDGIDHAQTFILVVDGSPLTLTSATPITADNGFVVTLPIRFTSPNATIVISGAPLVVEFRGPIVIAGGTLTIEAPSTQVTFFGPVTDEAPGSLVVHAHGLLMGVGGGPSTFSGILDFTGESLIAFQNSLGNANGATVVHGGAAIDIFSWNGAPIVEPLDLRMTGPASGLNLGSSVGSSVVDAGPIAISGPQRFFAGTDISLTGPISGDGRLVVAPLVAGSASAYSITLFSPMNSFTGGVEVMSGPTLRAGQSGVFPSTGDWVVDSGGTVDLATYPQSVRSFTCAGTLAMSPNGYLTVNQAPNIAGCTLQLTFAPGYVAPAAEIPILINSSLAPVMGAFNGLPEGSVVMVNGAVRYLSYGGGDGNDIVLRTTLDAPMTAVPQVQDMWWSGPAENGWGMSVIQHRDALLSVIFAYDAQSRPTWFVMPGGTWNATSTAYSGALYRPHGTPFNVAYDASNFVPGPAIGSATITFTDASSARLDYTIDGQMGFKLIERDRFGPTTGASGGRGDMWWGGASQNGWGLAILEQSPTIFPIWYTYDSSGNPMWFVMPSGTWTSPDLYEGPIYVTTGSPWVGRDYDRSLLHAFMVGDFTLRFAGASAQFDYSIRDVSGATVASGSIPIVRQPF